MLIAKNLYCRLGGQQVVEDFSIELQRGQVLGLLGPNGAGKTTSLRMIAGCLSPVSGEVLINGIDLATQAIAAKRQLGYLPEKPPLQLELSVKDYLIFAGRLRGLGGAALKAGLDEVLQACVLGDVQNRIIGSLSKGYKQRVGLAQALIHKPGLLILDEPTDGLDPNQLQHVRELIRSRASHCAILLSSHLLAEVEAVCSRVIIMRNGAQVYAADLNDLGSAAAPNSLTLKLRLAVEPDAALLSGLPGVSAVSLASANQLLIEAQAGHDPRAPLLSLCQQQNWPVLELIEDKPRLDQVFSECTA